MCKRKNIWKRHAALPGAGVAGQGRAVAAGEKALWPSKGGDALLADAHTAGCSAMGMVLRFCVLLLCAVLLSFGNTETAHAQEVRQVPEVVTTEKAAAGTANGTANGAAASGAANDAATGAAASVASGAANAAATGAAAGTANGAATGTAEGAAAGRENSRGSSAQEQQEIPPPERAAGPVEVTELWAGSLYSSTYKVGLCCSADGKVRGVVHLRLYNGKVDVYHIEGSVQNNEIQARHSSGHTFKGRLVSASKVEGVIKLKNGMSVNLEGSRTHDVPLAPENCAPLPQ